MHRFIPDPGQPTAEPDPQRAEAIKKWIRDALHLPPDQTITLTEANCRDAGCPVMETTATLWTEHREPRVIRFTHPKVAITRLMVIQTLQEQRWLEGSSPLTP